MMASLVKTRVSNSSSPLLQSEQLRWLSSRTARGHIIRHPLEQVPQQGH